MYVDDLADLLTVDQAVEALELATPTAVVLDSSIELEPFSDESVALVVDGERVPVSPEATLAFASKLGVPQSYAKKLPVDFLIENMKFWLRQSNARLKAWVVDRGSQPYVAGIGGVDSMFLPPRSVMQVLADVMTNAGGDVRVYTAHTSFTDVIFRLVNVTRGVEPVHDDLFFPGLSFSYSPTGTRATVIEGFNVRRVCTNGMLNTQAVERLRRSSTPEDPLDWIYEASMIVWMDTDAQFDRITAANTVIIPRNHVGEVLTELFEQYKIPATLRPMILREALEDDREQFTLLDLVNFITFVASHDPDVSLAQQERLFRAADVALQHQHICETCYRPIV